jgi:hypothetical protein
MVKAEVSKDGPSKESSSGKGGVHTMGNNTLLNRKQFRYK